MNDSPTPVPSGQRFSPLFVLAVIGLLTGHYVLGITASNDKSQTGDEGAHLTGGVTYWAFNDYRIQPENGNWPQRWCGLPVWLSGCRLPSTDSAAWKQLEQWTVAEQFFYCSGNDVDGMLRRGRGMTGLLGVALGLLVYACSRQMFGRAGGLMSLALFAFSPALLAHGFLVTSDLASALFFTASVAGLWRLLHRVSIATLGTAWFALSGLFLSKFSAPMIVPIGLILLAVRLANRAPLKIGIGEGRALHGRARQLVVLVGVAGMLVLGVAGSIWASYGFRYSLVNPALAENAASVPWQDVETSSATLERAIYVAREYHLLPEAYLFGLAHVLHHSEQRNAFFNGEFRRFGWLGFFPYCLAAKTPLAMFLLLGLAVAAVGYRARQALGADRGLRGPLRHVAYAAAPWLVFLAVYWWFALMSHLNIGHRHLLPTYPAMFILAGAAAWWFVSPANWAGPVAGRHVPATAASRPGVFVYTMRILVCASLVASAVEAISSWPHYLAYFNPLFGGPGQAYRHLADSSLDWSQDLKGVAAAGWMRIPRTLATRSVCIFRSTGAATGVLRHSAQRLSGFPRCRSQHAPRPLTGGTYLVSQRCWIA